MSEDLATTAFLALTGTVAGWWLAKKRRDILAEWVRAASRSATFNQLPPLSIRTPSTPQWNGGIILGPDEALRQWSRA